MIKFRIWDEKYNTWNTSGLMVYANNIICQGMIFQQFTGMLDKNGKEIYEGDIVKTYVYDGWFDIGDAKTCNYEIKWSHYDCGWRGFTSLMDNNSFAGVTFILTETEIIGNIFENKELL